MLLESGPAVDLSHRLARRLLPWGSVRTLQGVEADVGDGGLALPKEGFTIRDLEDREAFLVLGELGVGKTWLFENESRRLQHDPDSASLFVRLGEFSDASELDDLLTEFELQGAAALERPRYLFLDSLDQGLTRIPTLDKWLIRRLRRKRSASLKVRISSRMSVEAMALIGCLADVYAIPAADAAFLIAPLDLDDILNEARSRRLDDSRFWHAVKARNAEALATHPLTLDLLLRTYTRSGKLSGDLRAIFREACQILCTEHETPQFVRAPISQNVAYAVTARVAAAMSFSAIPNVSIAPPLERPSDVIGPEELTTTAEMVGDRLTDIGDRAIEYALTSAHFESTTAGTYRWTHLGLQDFMAAEWAIHRLSPDQIRAVLTHPLDPRGQVHPDLEEVAAWIAGSVPEVRAYLLKVQPLVLLFSQSPYGARSDPAALMRAILTPEVADRADWLLPNRSRLRRLRSDEVVEILRPLVRSNDVDPSVQSLALAIMRELRVKGLDDYLLQLLLRAETPERIAVRAGLALEKQANSRTRIQVARRLAESDADKLPDELKAVMLRIAWPSQMSTDDLFRVFTPPRDDVIGLYDVFPAEGILARLTAKDVTVALKWVREEVKHMYLPPNREALCRGIMEFVGKSLGESLVRESLARWLVTLASSEELSTHRDLLAPLQGDVRRARAVFETALRSAERPEAVATLGLLQMFPIVGSISWLGKRFRASSEQDVRSAWRWLIERTPVRSRADRAELEKVVEADQGLSWLLERPWSARKAASGVAIGVPSLSTLTAAGYDEVPEDDRVQRLQSALTVAAPSIDQILEITDLVWSSRSPFDKPLWNELPADMKAAVTRTFGRELGIPIEAGA